MELLLVDLLGCLRMDPWAQLPLDQKGLMAMDLGRVDSPAQFLLQELLQQVGLALHFPTRKTRDGQYDHCQIHLSHLGYCKHLEWEEHIHEDQKGE